MGHTRGHGGHLVGEPPALISAGPRYRSRSSGAESSCRSQSDFWLRAAYENMMIYHIELPMKITFSSPGAAYGAAYRAAYRAAYGAAYG